MSGNLINDYIKTHTQSAVPNVTFQSDEQKTASTSIPKESESDTLAFLDMYAQLKLNPNISTDGLTIREGKINGNNTLLKNVLLCSTKDTCTALQEGIIGNKKLQLEAHSKEDTEKEITGYRGEFNNKIVDLTVEVPKDKNKIKSFFKNLIQHKMYVPSYVSIRGTIDNKPYELTLPNTKVPRDADEKDLVSILLFNERLHPAVVNGQIVALRPDMVRVNRWKRDINKQENFFKDNFKPLLDQTIAMVFGGFLTMLSAKIFTKK